jgi:hypothetical protein
MAPTPEDKSIYLDTDSIKELIAHREKIHDVRKEVYNKFDIDILANDTLSSLSIWEIVRQYDPDYNTNFHRNGEDGKSKGVLIENKCATVTPAVKGTVGKAGFQFHAQGKLDHDRYIFAVRRKDNLKLARLWDISSAKGVAVVQKCLHAGKQQWIDKGMPNHDAIVVPEKILFDLQENESEIIDGCMVYKV